MAKQGRAGLHFPGYKKRQHQFSTEVASIQTLNVNPQCVHQNVISVYQ